MSLHAGSSNGGIQNPVQMMEEGKQSDHKLTERLVDYREVRRFESPPAYQFCKEELSCQTGVYVRRWRLETPFFSVRLHHWLHSDDKRYLHDHPWWFITVVLSGGYTDVSEDKKEHIKTGNIRYRPALHKHSVHVDQGGAWTLLLTGPKTRKWGFQVSKKWKKANKYFLEHGAHICD
jgi:hypothetical protein